jgi:hypothetical protein
MAIFFGSRLEFRLQAAAITGSRRKPPEGGTPNKRPAAKKYGHTV